MRRAFDPRTEAGFVRVRLFVPKFPIFLLLCFIAIFADLTFGSAMAQIDERVSQLWGPYEGPRGYGVFDLFDKLGQTTVAGIPLVLTTLLLARRLRSVRPIVIGVVGWMSMYGFVGVVKVATMRESPRTGGPDLFDSSNLFPSGHTSNIIFMFGLTVALIIRYYNPAPWQRLMLVSLVPAAFVFMSMVSIYRHTHWFTDVVAGGLVGAIALSLCLRADDRWSMVRFWVRLRTGRAWSALIVAVQVLRAGVLAGTPGTAGAHRARRWSPTDLDYGLRPSDDRAA